MKNLTSGKVANTLLCPLRANAAQFRSASWRFIRKSSFLIELQMLFLCSLRGTAAQFSSASWRFIRKSSLLTKLQILFLCLLRGTVTQFRSASWRLYEIARKFNAFFSIVVFILLPVCLFFPACKENTTKKTPAKSPVVYGKISAEHGKTIKVLKKQSKPVNETAKILNNGKKKIDVTSIGKQTGLKSNKKQNLYTSEGKVDPFAPLISNDHKKASLNSRAQTKPRRILTPLEKFDFSQIRLVAVVTAASGNIAMVEDSTRKGYTIRIGTYIGKNGGRVVKIDNDRVIVKENVKNYKGESVIRSEVLKLNKPDNGD